MKKSHRAPVISASEIYSCDRQPETPAQRVERLYADQSGPLVAWLLEEAQTRGQQLSEMAETLGVTYGYINQLRTGVREVARISPDFARSCAHYLGVPVAVVKLVSGSISVSDFAWPPQDEALLVERAFKKMLNDPSVRHSLPHRPHLLPVDAKRALVSLYADTTGVDLFGVRQLPEIVHWLQRAAMLHDDHEGRAIEAKQARRLGETTRQDETAAV